LINSHREVSAVRKNPPKWLFDLPGKGTQLREEEKINHVRHRGKTGGEKGRFLTVGRERALDQGNRSTGKGGGGEGESGGRTVARGEKQGRPPEEITP